jgi:hypothetical protein
MPILTCNIPDEIDARLEEMARQAKTSKDGIVRKVLEQATQNGTKGVSAFELAGDLCGSLSGPSDLATNPKYLEGFGD